MDWVQATIEAFGGGPGALAIAVLGFVSWKLLQWYRAALEDRIQDGKAHAEQLREVSKEMGTVAEAVRALTREVERRG